MTFNFWKILGWKRIGKTTKNHYNGDMARIVDEAIIIGEFSMSLTPIREFWAKNPISGN